MSRKTVLKTAAALGILSVSAILGNVGASALWSDEVSESYSYSLPGLSVEYSIDNNELQFVGTPQFSSNSNSNIQNLWNNSNVNTQAFVEELTNNNEMYRIIELNVETYGAASYSNIVLNASNLTKNGPILDYAAQYATQISDPSECNDSILSSQNIVQDGENISTNSNNIYSNESKSLYLCVGYILPTEIGEEGTHTNTVTVTGSDENDVQVTDNDSWSGSVVKKTMTATDWEEFVEEQVEILNNSNTTISYRIDNTKAFSFNPETFEPRSTYPDFSEGQPIYDDSTPQ